MQERPGEGKGNECRPGNLCLCTLRHETERFLLRNVALGQYLTPLIPRPFLVQEKGIAGDIYGSSKRKRRHVSSSGSWPRPPTPLRLPPPSHPSLSVFLPHPLSCLSLPHFRASPPPPPPPTPPSFLSLSCIDCVREWWTCRS